MSPEQKLLIVFSAVFVLCAGTSFWLSKKGFSEKLVTRCVTLLVACCSCIIIIAAAGPERIESLIFNKDGGTINLATPEEQNESLEYADKKTKLPLEKLEEITRKAETQPVNQRTDADYLVLAMEAHRNDRHEKALQYAYTGLSMPPSSIKIIASLFNRVASAYGSMGFTDKSIDYYKRAITIEPDFSWPYFNLGKTYYGLAKTSANPDFFDDALAFYEKAIDLDPDDVSGDDFFTLGSIYQEKGNMNRAEEYFTKAAEIGAK